MPIVLPRWPGPSTAEVTYLDYGTNLDGGPQGGGPRIHRLGNRFSINVKMPALRLEPMLRWGVGARVFLSRLRAGISEGVIYPFPQPGLEIGAPGVPLVSAAVAANVASLSLQGMRPGYVWREGQFFNVYRADGRAMLASTTGEAQVAADGTVALPILPRLRTALAAGSRINMEPVIEGRLLIKDGFTWSFDPSRFVGLSFTIEEYGSN